MINEGLSLMVTGMGVVFAFLTLLVLSMNLAAGFFQKFADLFEEEPLPSAKPRTAVIQQSDDELAEIAAAIAAVKACTG